jgi:hypothetical protein
MAAARYHIPDEPLPTDLARFAVNPQWPMFAQMLAGSWLAIPWFVFNGLALGSPTRNREMLLAALSIAGVGALVFGLDYAQQIRLLDGVWLRIAALSIIVLKIGVAYALYFSQARVFEIWRYYGGMPKSGLAVVLLGSYFGPQLLAAAVHSDFLHVVLR